MFYKEFAELAGHLTTQRLGIDEILQTLCLRRIADRHFLASFYLNIERDGSLALSNFYGATPDFIHLSDQPLSVFSDHPASESVRSDAMIWKEWQPLTESEFISKISLLAWPVHSESRTVGTVIVLVDSLKTSNPEILEFFEALADVINGAISRHLNGTGKGPSPKKRQGELGRPGGGDESLTERQVLILKMITEGRTNADIADVLGYSESLIRQETIRIYAKLGCSGRAEASLIYRSTFEEATDRAEGQKSKNRVALPA